MNKTETILFKEGIHFRKRFLKSLFSPWVFLVIGLLVLISVRQPILWIVTTLFVMTFILMNYKAMGQYLIKIETDNNFINFYYLNVNNRGNVVKVALDDLAVDYYNNGKGISSLVSDHMRIEKKGKIIIKQYVSDGWTLNDLKETTKKLKEIKY